MARPEGGRSPFLRKLEAIWWFLFTAGSLAALIAARLAERPHDRPGSRDEWRSSQPLSQDVAAVLPFDDERRGDRSVWVGGLGPYTFSFDPRGRRQWETGPAITCELGGGTDEMRQDGKTLARTFASQLGEAGLFQSVRYAESPEDLAGATVIIRGEVALSRLRIFRDGNRGYAIVVAMAASRPPAWPAWLHRRAPPFWQGSASRELRVTGAIKEKESLPLMQGFYAKAAGELAEALKGASAPPSPPAKN